MPIKDSEDELFDPLVVVWVLPLELELLVPSVMVSPILVAIDLLKPSVIPFVIPSLLFSE